MRPIKILLLAVILIAIVVLALANRAPVTLHLLPEGLARLAPMTLQVPLFVVILVSILLGIVIGYLFEWLREVKHRRRARAKAREATRLSHEVERLRRATGRPEDEVLALVNS